MKKIVLTCLILTIGTGVFAQTLDLEQARTLALANSRSLAGYELSIRNSILNERSQLYSMLPSVSAGYSASVDYLEKWNFINPIDTFKVGATLSITQIIFQGGKSFINKAIREISTESVRKSALAEYFNVLDSVDNAYYAVLESYATLEAAESSLQTAVLALSIAEIRQGSGMLSQGDYLNALINAQSRENSRNQARRNLSLNITKLKALLGITDNFELEQIDFSAYEGVLTRLSGITDEQLDELFETFWDIVAADNPSLARAALSTQTAERNLTLSYRNYLPTISVTFDTGLNYSTSNGFSTNGQGSVSLRGTIPLDFWVMNNDIEQRKNALASSQLDYINAQSSLVTNLRTAVFNAITQAETVLSSRRSLEYAEKNFEYVMERYRLSQSSVSELNNALTNLIDNRNTNTRASYSFLQSISSLRSLCALDDEERLIGILMGAPR